MYHLSRLTSYYLLLFILNCSFTFAQDFRVDSLLMERTTIAKNDSLGISVIKKVIATNGYRYNTTNRNNPVQGYVIKSEYWLFWNNKSDSMPMSISNGHKILEKNFNISFRQLQNKINAVILEYSEVKDPDTIIEDTKRIFQVIDLDKKRKILYNKVPEFTHRHNENENSIDLIDSYDTYLQKYILTFDENDNITFTHTKSLKRTEGAKYYAEIKPTSPKQFYTLTYEVKTDLFFYERNNH